MVTPVYARIYHFPSQMRVIIRLVEWWRESRKSQAWALSNHSLSLIKYG